MRIRELEMERFEYFRSLRSAGRPGSDEFAKVAQDMQAKMKEFEDKSFTVLNPEQKKIWTERLAELKKAGNE